MIQGTPTTISAPSPQVVNGVTYTFSGWSDGGEQTHLVGALPGETGPFIATYVAGGQSGAPSCSVSAASTAVSPGGSTTLSWTSSNATAISIDNGVGALTPVAAGSRAVTPAASTQYTATVTGAGGTASCSVSVTVSTGTVGATVWRSESATLTAGAPQAVLRDESGSKSTQLDFYESSSNDGVDRGTAFVTFNGSTHPETFNHVENVWSASGSLYPYAGKSTVNRGSDTGEGNAFAPSSARDLQLHPPANGNQVVAAFRVPEAGNYSVSGLAARRVDDNGDTARLRLYGPAKNVLATVLASSDRAWSRSAQTYEVGALQSGDYIYFAVDAVDGYGWDATEIAWAITRASSPPSGPSGPSAATCSITATPAVVALGGSTMLTWTSANATSLTVDQAVGALSPAAAGSRSVTPSSDTTYTVTAAGTAGNGACSVSVTVTAAATQVQWRSYDVTLQAGATQGAAPDSTLSRTAQLEFYESSNTGVDRGVPFTTFLPEAHPEDFNHAGTVWTSGTAPLSYPYVAKSTVTRGNDAGEANAAALERAGISASAAFAVRDLQLHPPDNAHNVVAAFRVPQAGNYSVSGLAVRRIDASGDTVRLRLYGPAKSELANLQATNDRAWVRSDETYLLGSLAAGDYIYFAVNSEDGYGWDATEIDWLITADTDGSRPVTPPAAATCSITATPASVPLGGSATLRWSSANATSLALDHGLGALTPVSGGSMAVTPTASTQYTATAAGAGGNGGCSVSVTVTSPDLTETIWRSYDTSLQAGSPQGLLRDTSSTKSTQLEFYESSNAGVERGVAFTSFLPQQHPEGFNHAQGVWTNGTAADAYPYAAKSTVNRGDDAGESNAVAPLTARDLQLHPPDNGNYVVAAFRVPEDGNYRVSGLAARRVDTGGDYVRLRLYGPAKTALAEVLAGNDRAWARSSATYELGALAAGDYIYFAVDAADGYGWDAAEIDWQITRTAVAVSELTQAITGVPAAPRRVTATATRVTAGSTGTR